MSTKCGLLLIWDWPDELRRTLVSAGQFLPGIGERIVLSDQNHELGFIGAMREGWRLVRKQNWDYVFHLEGDFVFEKPVPLAGMIEILEHYPYLAQVALKRWPVNEMEIAAGGIVEARPERGWEEKQNGEKVWTEGRFFTTNPCVYRTSLCERGWPTEPDSESAFMLKLLEDPDMRSAYWGPKFGEPMVRHIGEHRGWGY